MSKQPLFCCTVWEALVLELAEAKLEELSKLQVPPSLLAPTRKVLNSMDNFCPVCGYSFKLPQPVQQVAHMVPSVLSQPVDKGPCPACKGVGNRGADENGIPYNCGTCLGSGKWTNDNDASVRSYIANIKPRNVKK